MVKVSDILIHDAVQMPFAQNQEVIQAEGAHQRCVGWCGDLRDADRESARHGSHWVCSTRNLDMVRAIGADYVVDYTREDFTRRGQLYDLIFDAVGNCSVSDLRRALKPNGTCSIAGFTTLPRLFGHMLLGPLMSRLNGKDVGLMGTVATNKDDLLFLQRLLADGKVIPVIDRCYPLNETAEAIRYLETMRARGKVIITIRNNT